MTEHNDPLPLDPPSRRRPARRSAQSGDASQRNLDALDLQILDVLGVDARLSSRAIARELGVAAGTVADRIGRLEESGVIFGYAAQVDPARLGRPLGFVIGLQITQGNDLTEVLDELTELPEVDDVFVVTGQWDLLVLGRVRDPEHLNELLIKRLWRSPSFRHSETMLVIGHHRR